MLPLMGVEEEELLVIGFKGEEGAEAEDFFFIDGRSNNKTKSASTYKRFNSPPLSRSVGTRQRVEG